MEDNLLSLNKLRSDIKAMKLLALFLKPDQREQLRNLEKQLDNMLTQTAAFNERFSSYGWCAYDSMSFALIESANDAFDKSGIEAAEQVLINYYTDDVSKIVHWIQADKIQPFTFNISSKRKKVPFFHWVIHRDVVVAINLLDRHGKSQFLRCGA